MTVLVTGSRDWQHADLVWDVLTIVLVEKGGQMLLVHGDCPKGVDSYADRWAMATPGVQVRRFPADWSKGTRAGFLRNYTMVHAMPYDLCLAFIRDASKGATMTLEMAERLEIPVNCYREWSHR